MQVEINGEEKAVQASDIKVGDVITWGACTDYYMCIWDDADVVDGYQFIRLTTSFAGSKMDIDIKDMKELDNLSIVTDKCKLVVTL